MPLTQPPHDCPLCPRLVAFREEAQRLHPDWHNNPVPYWGDDSARLIIIGLAPGLKGANRTGRPFTGDYAGDLLYATLLKVGLATGTYEQRPDDSLRLKDTLIVNGVACVPPENKPTTDEIRTCRQFVVKRLKEQRPLAYLALGRIAHDQLLVSLEPGLETFGGKCVVNVVDTSAPDKGDAVVKLVERTGADAAVFVGDDVNDEAVFVRAPPHWLTVRIGRDDPRSRAAYFLDGHAEVALFLGMMLNALSSP